MDFNKIIDTVVSKGLMVVIALIILIVSFKIINVVAKRLTKKLENKKKLDKTTVKTLIYIAKISLKILVCVSLVGYLGIDTSGITALITSLGVCAGLAVNGALSNLAGGLLILINKPFKVDDYIEACGYAGFVEDIRIINTKIRTYDNKTVYLPNGTLSSQNIVNHFDRGTRRIDLTIDVAYGTDIEKAEKVAVEALLAVPQILSDPAPWVRVWEHGDSGIRLIVWPWCRSEDYWEALFSSHEAVKKAFDREGITVPFNQVDVHIIK